MDQRRRRTSVHVARGRDGTLRSVHDVGLPLLFAPYVAVIRPAVRGALTWLPARWLERARLQPETLYRHVLSSGMIVIALLLANQLLTTLLVLGIRRKVAIAVVLLVVLLVALSPPLAIYSITFFTELLSALMCAFEFQRIVVANDDRVPPWAWAGGVAGLAVAIARAPPAVVNSIVGLQIVLSAYFWQNPKKLWNDGDGIAAVCESSGFTGCSRLPSFVQASDAVPSS